MSMLMDHTIRSCGSPILTVLTPPGLDLPLGRAHGGVEDARGRGTYECELLQFTFFKKAHQ